MVDLFTLKNSPCQLYSLALTTLCRSRLGEFLRSATCKCMRANIKADPDPKKLKLGNLSTVVASSIKAWTMICNSREGCCQRASCFWLQNDNNCKCTLFSGSSSCCIVNLLTKNQLGFVQQAENNISKLVAGIFCKLSEEQFILGVDLIHPDPLNPPRDLRISGHHPPPPPLYRSMVDQNIWCSRFESSTTIPPTNPPLKLQKIKWIVCQIGSAPIPP